MICKHHKRLAQGHGPKMDFGSSSMFSPGKGWTKEAVHALLSIEDEVIEAKQAKQMQVYQFLLKNPWGAKELRSDHLTPLQRSVAD